MFKVSHPQELVCRSYADARHPLRVDPLVHVWLFTRAVECLADWRMNSPRIFGHGIV